MTTVLEVLNKARHYIDRFDWAKHNYGDPWHGFCITGACRAAVDVTDGREIGLPKILTHVYAAFTEPLRNRGKNPWRYSEKRPRGALSTRELELYREPLADAGDLIEYNDEDAKTKQDILNLFDEAIECATKDIPENGMKK